MKGWQKLYGDRAAWGGGQEKGGFVGLNHCMVLPLGGEGR